MIRAQIKLDTRPLDGLRKTLVSKILKKATTEASRVVRDAVKSNATAVKRYGYLGKSIGIKIKTYAATKSAMAVIGPRTSYIKTRGTYTRGKRKGQPRLIKPSKYMHFIEGGSRRFAARPILQPALASTKSTFENMLSNALRKAIEAEVSKLQSKA